MDLLKRFVKQYSTYESSKITIWPDFERHNVLQTRNNEWQKKQIWRVFGVLVFFCISPNTCEELT